jgi:hypothetical protein
MKTHLPYFTSGPFRGALFGDGISPNPSEPRLDPLWSGFVKHREAIYPRLGGGDTHGGGGTRRGDTTRSRRGAGHRHHRHRHHRALRKEIGRSSLIASGVRTLEADT